VDVLNHVKNMRLSPVLVALLAATATLGFSNTARGESMPTESVPGGTAPTLATDTVVTDTVVVDPAGVNPAATGRDALTTSQQLQFIEGKIGPGTLAIAPAEMILDAIPTTPILLGRAKDVAPAATVPTSTPLIIAQTEQETPDRIQINPGSAPIAPAGTADPVSPTTSPAEPPTGSPSLPTAPAADEPRVLVSEVEIKGVEGAVAPDIARTIEDKVYAAIRTQPGVTTTRTLLQEDINAIFKTGYFSNVKALPEDTPLGVRVTFEVQLNPILREVKVEGKKILPDAIVEAAFKPQYGSVLNLVELEAGIKEVNGWYQKNGYVLAQVLGSPQIAEDGTVTLQIAEGEVEAIQVRFLTKDGKEVDAKGNPIRGKTRDFIVTREFELKPGAVFNRDAVQKDLQRVFGLGIFEDVKLSLNPGQDPRKVVVVANVTEKNTGSIAAGAGVSSASGLFGTVSYQQQNIGGNNQRLGAELQVGQRELLFDFNFTDPWIAGDPYRTSYTFNLFRRRTISLIFDGGDPEVRLPINEDGDSDRPRIRRTGAALSFSRPLSKDVFRPAEWNASLGFQYQAISIRDANGDLAPRDALGNDLSFSGSGKDDLFTVQLGAVRDRRNDRLRPTSGSLLRFGTEQSIPIGNGSIFLNRLRASYSFYKPTQFLKFSKGCQPQRILGTTKTKKPSVTDCPQAFAFNIQAGTVLGDLPPYEAFSIGGSNSVRGYDEGELAAARSFLQATAEYRFPIFSVISGALFVDAATDFGSQSSVLGNPGGVRNKPGAGIGYGLGVRIQSPLGPIRIDYGFNDQGDSRLHFGIGERF
jgi:outer membrane protein insertion porin family